MATKYTGELPDIPANEGYPTGVPAPEDIRWDHPTAGEITLIKKGQSYNAAYLAAIQAGAASGKPRPSENKVEKPAGETK